MYTLPLLLIALPAGLGATHCPRAQACADQPVVHLDDGAFIGKINNTVDEFRGIPFAQST